MSRNGNLAPSVEFWGFATFTLLFFAIVPLLTWLSVQGGQAGAIAYLSIWTSAGVAVAVLFHFLRLRTTHVEQATRLLGRLKS